MHQKRRGVGFLLTLVLLIALLPTASARQFQVRELAGGDTAETAEMLAGIATQTFAAGVTPAAVRANVEHFLNVSQFAAFGATAFPCRNGRGYWGSLTDGTYTNTVNATGCFAYCKFVAQVIYGAQGARLPHNERAGNVTGAGLNAFLTANAQAGEHLRVDSKHSVTFLSRTEEGFYYTDYGGDGNPYIRLRYTTYSNFAARCNELRMKVWLYNASPVVNGAVVAAAADTVTVDAIKADTMEASDWFYGGAVASIQMGLVQEPAADVQTYKAPITLAETITMVARIHSLNTVGGKDFEAIDGAAWYTPYVNYLGENGITLGVQDYEKCATREQFAYMMSAAFSEPDAKGGAALQFTDANQITYSAEVMRLCRAGIITGISRDGGLYFSPENLITRAEAVTILARMAEPTLRAAVD